MVGNDVQEQAETVIAKCRQPGGMLIGRADLGIEHAVIGDVVAVRAAGRGLEIGRRIAVRDAQAGQVRHDRQGIPEPEAGMKLDAVGRLWGCPPAADLLEGRCEQPLGVSGVIGRGV